MFRKDFRNDGASVDPVWASPRFPSLANFMIVPMAQAGAGTLAAVTIYALAYEQACAALRPSRRELLLATIRN